MKMESDENVQIVVENEKFSLRKKDLVDSSDFFNAMFSGRYAESRQKCIFLKEPITKEAFGIFCDYLSFGRFPADSKFRASLIPDLFLAAHFLHCHDFLDALTDKILALVAQCSSYSPILFLFGEEMMLDDLQKAAFDAMKRDPLSAASSEDFTRLPFELLEQLIAENYD